MRTKKTVFVLISGKAGVGKTTLSNYLAMQLSNYTGISVMEIAFANTIKSVARNIFGWDGNKDVKGRRLLQVIGTECGREYDENIWVKKTVDNVFQMNLYPPNFVIIDDWRFPNECTYIEDLEIHDVITIRVEALNREILKGTQEENHLSETALSNSLLNIQYDFIVDNTKDYNNLYHQGDEIVQYLEQNFILE